MKQQSLITFLFSSTYISQHIGSAFINMTLVVILRQHGATLSQLSLLQFIILPYSLRFLWAPLVDRFGSPRWGHFRSWLLPTQCAMVLFLLSASTFDPLADIHTLFVILFLFMIMTGTQDLALDGLACSGFDKNERHVINSIQVACGLIGNLIGGALVIIYPHIHWHGALWILASLSAVPIVFIILFKEHRTTSQTALSLRIGWMQLVSFWRGKLHWLGLLFLYSVIISGCFAILSPVLVDAGWSFAQIGTMKNYGVIVGLISVVLIVPLSKKYPREKSLRLLTALQLVCLGCFIPLLQGQHTVFWAYLAVTASYLCFAPIFTLNSALMMDLAAKTDLPSTSYTVQIAVMMLFSICSSALCLHLAEHMGYQWVVYLSISCALLVFICIPYVIQGLFYDKNAHRGS
ncbi:MFS transporter [Pasteurellaceae bacterium 20609_3]|uniref:MFS transporter n=1 Tax=Spirabiliibacterium mucosae TaxID=28156 RepID=UPI001AAD77AE|nr:MFS transporter [Spirabiliibacterium mucosae]MBE2897390.1 MFS transporter [Spirabiliibacterium mucosae]